jgi:hypothetical protein
LQEFLSVGFKLERDLQRSETEELRSNCLLPLCEPGSVTQAVCQKAADEKEVSDGEMRNYLEQNAVQDPLDEYSADSCVTCLGKVEHSREGEYLNAQA